MFRVHTSYTNLSQKELKEIELKNHPDCDDPDHPGCHFCEEEENDEEE